MIPMIELAVCVLGFNISSREHSPHSTKNWIFTSTSMTLMSVLVLFTPAQRSMASSTLTGTPRRAQVPQSALRIHLPLFAFICIYLPLSSCLAVCCVLSALALALNGMTQCSRTKRQCHPDIISISNPFDHCNVSDSAAASCDMFHSAVSLGD